MEVVTELETDVDTDVVNDVLMDVEKVLVAEVDKDDDTDVVCEVESDVVELRRLCCIDDTPKNTESYFIGHTLRWLKKNTDYKVVVSYADSNYNHTGTIYQATNFEYHGMTANGRVIDFNGKHYHDKTIRTYYTDKYGVKKLKPYAQKVRDALESGEAKYVETTGKHIYLFKLKKRGKK